jgi:hypothetical protein
MARPRTRPGPLARLAAPGLVAGLLLAVSSPAPAGPDGAEPFEIVIVRGAGVSRVTGTRDGVVREEILREDPRPARSRPEPKPTAAPSGTPIVVVLHGGSPADADYGLAFAPWPTRHRDARHPGPGGRGIERHVWSADRPSQRFYHVRTRAHGRPADGRPPR